MSTTVLFAVLFAALLHATWNAIVKGARDPMLSVALVNFSSSVILLPLAFAAAPPAREAWPFLAASVLIHVGYFTALTGAYRAGDLSYGYPLMRGIAPMLVAPSSFFAFGEVPGPLMWAGIVLICLGVLSIGLIGHRWTAGSARATAWALSNAVLIACYTLVDAAGVRASGSALGYIAWLFVLNAIPYSVLVLALRRREALDYARSAWRRGAVSGACSAGSYGIALWAMTQAPVAPVAALRETSVIFAALIGTVLMREGRIAPRLAGAIAVAFGIAALKF